MKLLTIVTLFLIQYYLVQGQTTKPACCDAIVRGYDGSGVGIKCSEGGVDCAFSGQITANCESINGLTDTHIGINCSPST